MSKMDGVDAITQVRANISSLLLYHELQQQRQHDQVTKRKCFWRLSSVAKSLASLHSEHKEQQREDHKSTIYDKISEENEAVFRFDISQDGVGSIENLQDSFDENGVSKFTQSKHAPLKRLLANVNVSYAEDEALELNESTPTSSRFSRYEDRLNYMGFTAVREFLRDQYRVNVSYTIHLETTGKYSRPNVGYYFDNDPLPGWGREVMIRVVGRDKGFTDVHYISPDGLKRLRSRADLMNYFDRNGWRHDSLRSFDFRKTYCVCFTSENPRVNYLACSCGLSGCGGWIHPECVGLGYRTHEELERIPPVICPLCAAYLEGTGEMDKYLIGETIVLQEITTISSISINEEDNIDDSEKEVEGSDIPHILWGFEGHPKLVYCVNQNESILQPTRKYTKRKKMHFDEQSTSSAVASSIGATAAMRNSLIFSPGKEVNNAVQKQHASSQSKGIFQHRLFQGLVPSTVKDTSAAVAINDSNEYLMSSGSKKRKVIVDDKICNGNTGLVFDEDSEIPFSDMVPKFHSKMYIWNRVRSAYFDDGFIQRIRVIGGWMKTNPSKASSNLNSFQCWDQYLHHTKYGTHVKAARHEECSSNSVASTQVRTEGSNLQIDEAVDPNDPKLIRSKIISRAGSLRMKASVGRRFRSDIIGHGVDKALARIKRPGRTSQGKFNTGYSYQNLTTSVTAMLRSGPLTKSAMDELRNIYQTPPPLCYLPVEDGGIRFSSPITAFIPRSLHALCVARMVCACCFEYASHEAIQKSYTASTKKSNGKVRRPLPKLKERYDLRKVVSGPAHYFVHEQCIDALSGTICFERISGSASCDTQELVSPSLFSTWDSEEDYFQAPECTPDWNIVPGHPFLAVGVQYTFSYIDDTCCDICGRYGGLMRFFRISPSLSLLQHPNVEGWLGHFPCIYYALRCNVFTAPPQASVLFNTHVANDIVPPDDLATVKFYDLFKCDIEAVQSNDLSRPQKLLTLPSSSSLPIQFEGKDVSSADGRIIIEDTVNSIINVILRTDVRNTCGNDSEIINPVNMNGESSKHCLESEYIIFRTIQDIIGVIEHKHLDAHQEGNHNLSHVKLGDIRKLQPISLFDQIMGKYRCALCGIQHGIVMRCASAGCTVRAHALCASLADSDWQLKDVEVHCSRNISKTICFFCPLHCN